MSDNEGLVNPADYQVDAFIDHLDRNGTTIKSYTLRGAFPTTISEIGLNINQQKQSKLLKYHLDPIFRRLRTTT